MAYDGDIRKLGHFIRYRAEKMMAKLASKPAVDRSPGLKSQVSAEGNSDVENMAIH